MVNDGAISKISSRIKESLAPDTLIIHFSGTFSNNKIDPYFSNVSCAWPIQSLSAHDDSIDLKEIPLVITSSTETTNRKTASIFESISNQIYFFTEEEKSILHLSAVFANNFTNHLYAVSKSLLEQNHLNFEILIPIIKQTTSKILTKSPEESQTGPAIREDKDTIAMHVDILREQDDYQAIYNIMTKSIIKSKK